MTERIEMLKRFQWDKRHHVYRRAAEENRALLADVGRRFYQLPGTQDLYAADGVHPSGQGARIAAETIAAAIQRHKEDPS